MNNIPHTLFIQHLCVSTAPGHLQAMTSTLMMGIQSCELATKMKGKGGLVRENKAIVSI